MPYNRNTSNKCIVCFSIALAISGYHPVAGQDCRSCRQDTGDLNLTLKDVFLPGCGSEKFSEIEEEETRNQWVEVIGALLGCDFESAAQLADGQNYDLIEYVDDGNARTYYVLLERLDDEKINPLRGQGTYVFNPAADRLLNIQAPHAKGDLKTHEESVDIFTALNPAFLQIAGTSRCANSAATPCDGCTTACVGCFGLTLTCGGPPVWGTSYRESDVAHHVDNFFQVSSNTVHEYFPEFVSISVHRFNASTNDPMHTSIAQISNGTTGTVSNSLATRLALAYNVIFDGLGYSGAGAASVNAAPDDPPEVMFAGSPWQPGPTNVQGRYINDEVNPCTQNVADAPLPERFLHLEQEGRLAHDPTDEPNADPGYENINWNITIQAIGNVFPRNVWVDFAHAGTALGHLCEPYAELGNAIDDAGAEDVIRVKAGSSGNLSITISTPETLRSFGGSAVIGS